MSLSVRHNDTKGLWNCPSALVAHLILTRTSLPLFRLFQPFSLILPEIPKTETNFEERLILKAFLLKFMNAYAPIFYVAFFKGR